MSKVHCVAQCFGFGYTCPECKMTWEAGDKDVICGRTLLTKEEIRTNLTELSAKMGEPLEPTVREKLTIAPQEMTWPGFINRGQL